MIEKGGRNDDGIADGPGDEPARVSRLHDALADLMLRREGTLAGLVGDDFERAEEPDVPHLAHQRMALEAFKLGLQGGGDRLHIVQQAAGLRDEGNRLQRDRRRGPGCRRW